MHPHARVRVAHHAGVVHTVAHHWLAHRVQDLWLAHLGDASHHQALLVQLLAPVALVGSHALLWVACRGLWEPRAGSGGRGKASATTLDRCAPLPAFH